jgi:hypothetical protein
VKFKPSCRDVTRMVLAGQDRQLGPVKLTLIRVHRLFCRACDNFGKQVELMRKASARWRSYGDE